MLNQTETKIIVPLKDNAWWRSNRRVIRAVIDRMVSTFGGATAWEGRGFWKSPETGKLYNERVMIITSAAPAKADTTDKLRDLAGWVLNNTKQEAVFIEVGTTPEIIFRKED